LARRLHAPYLSITHSARSLSRQRTTPCTAGIGLSSISEQTLSRYLRAMGEARDATIGAE
jgi:hypothetical protein